MSNFRETYERQPFTSDLSYLNARGVYSGDPLFMDGAGTPNSIQSPEDSVLLSDESLNRILHLIDDYQQGNPNALEANEVRELSTRVNDIEQAQSDLPAPRFYEAAEKTFSAGEWQWRRENKTPARRPAPVNKKETYTQKLVSEFSAPNMKQAIAEIRTLAVPPNVSILIPAVQSHLETSLVERYGIEKSQQRYLSPIILGEALLSPLESIDLETAIHSSNLWQEFLADAGVEVGENIEPRTPSGAVFIRSAIAAHNLLTSEDLQDNPDGFVARVRILSPENQTTHPEFSAIADAVLCAMVNREKSSDTRDLLKQGLLSQTPGIAKQARAITRVLSELSTRYKQDPFRADTARSIVEDFEEFKEAAELARTMSVPSCVLANNQRRNMERVIPRLRLGVA